MAGNCINENKSKALTKIINLKEDKYKSKEILIDNLKNCCFPHYRSDKMLTLTYKAKNFLHRKLLMKTRKVDDYLQTSAREKHVNERKIEIYTNIIS